MEKGVVLFTVILLLTITASACFPADIVTVPTANQLRQGEISVSYFYVNLNMPTGVPESARVQMLHLGVTDRLEIDAHRNDIDILGDATIINASYSLLRQTSKLPDVVVGGRNLNQAVVGRVPGSDKTSWFIAAARTLNLPTAGPPTPPVIRLHLGYGTEDHTLMNVDRHDGFFGGIQARLTPGFGMALLYDGEDIVTAASIIPQNSDIYLRGGTFGEHTFIGITWTGTL